MSEENAEGTVENTKTAEELQESLRKAEAKIVELKKSTATPEKPKEEAPAETTGFDEQAFERKYEEKKFFEANPDMVEYKDKITEYTSKGINFAKAKILVEADDETIKNRKVASQTNFTSGDVPQAQASYTQEQVAQMPIEQRKQVWGQAKAGKVTIT